MLNPPYGERIDAKGRGSQRGAPRTFTLPRGDEPAGGDDHADASHARGGRESAVMSAGGGAGDFFAQLATHWKRGYAGWTAWVLSPDMKLPTSMRLKESRRVPMWNGPIECRLFRFDMVAGSARAG
jgi:putative N6-adenine-specific DNA methylase